MTKVTRASDRPLVLIADVRRDSAEQLAARIEEAGARTAIARSAEAAVGIAREQRPEAALVHVAFDGRQASHVAALVRDLVPDAVLVVFGGPADASLFVPVVHIVPGASVLRALPTSWPDRLILDLASFASALCKLRPGLAASCGPEPSKVHHLPLDFKASACDYEAALIVLALAETGGCQRAAARGLGIHEATLRTKMEKYGLVAPSDDKPTPNKKPKRGGA